MYSCRYIFYLSKPGVLLLWRVLVAVIRRPMANHWIIAHCPGYRIYYFYSRPINTKRWSLFRIPITFAPANTHANVLQRVPSYCFGKLWLWGGTLPIWYQVKCTGISGNTWVWETAKIAHKSHNDVKRLCWHVGAIIVLLAELGLQKPPSGNPKGKGLGLLGEGCTFPLLLWSNNRCELGETEERGYGATPPPPWRVGRFCPPPLIWTSPSRRLHLIYFDFKSCPHFKIASFAYVYAYPVIFTVTRQLDTGQLGTGQLGTGQLGTRTFRHWTTGHPDN